MHVHTGCFAFYKTHTRLYEDGLTPTKGGPWLVPLYLNWYNASRDLPCTLDEEILLGMNILSYIKENHIITWRLYKTLGVLKFPATLCTIIWISNNMHFHVSCQEVLLILLSCTILSFIVCCIIDVTLDWKSIAKILEIINFQHSYNVARSKVGIDFMNHS